MKITYAKVLYLLECHPLCLQCTTNATYCTVCQNSGFNIIAESNTCKCKEGYFFDVKTNSSICGSCNILCEACTDEATICQSCKSSMDAVLDGNTCVCANGYYLTENSTCARTFLMQHVMGYAKHVMVKLIQTAFRAWKLQESKWFQKIIAIAKMASLS
jgi:hypothetical protein